MSTVDYEVLKEGARIIKNEVIEEANTATRVGSELLSMIDAMEQSDEEQSGSIGTLDGRVSSLETKVASLDGEIDELKDDVYEVKEGLLEKIDRDEAVVVVLHGTVSAPTLQQKSTTLSSTDPNCIVVFDTQRKYVLLRHGATVITYKYYRHWADRTKFSKPNSSFPWESKLYKIGGAYYRWNGTDMVIVVSHPIEVESEAKMQEMIDAGAAVEGQLYYTKES